jgi:hypothetical protein
MCLPLGKELLWRQVYPETQVLTSSHLCCLLWALDQQGLRTPSQGGPGVSSRMPSSLQATVMSE